MNEIAGLLGQLTDWILSWGQSPFGWVALFLVAFWDSSILPVPPDGLMMVLILSNPLFAIPLAALATVGSLLGAWLGYWIGLVGGRPLVYRIVPEPQIRYVERKYRENDTLALLLACFTPLPYKAFAIGAGVCQINFKRFMLISLVGRAGRFLAVALAVMFLGERVRGLVEDYTGPVAVGFVAVVAVAIFALGWYNARVAGRES